MCVPLLGGWAIFFLSYFADDKILEDGDPNGRFLLSSAEPYGGGRS